MIDQAFINQATEILIRNSSYLSGDCIRQLFSRYSVEFNVRNLPHLTEKGFPSRHIAFKDNLKCFSDEQQFLIIRELCLSECYKDNLEAQTLITSLAQAYPDFVPQETTKELIDSIEQLRCFLDSYSFAKKQYEAALNKKNAGIFERNMLDDLRLSFELLLRSIFNNELSFEKQKNKIGEFLSDKDVSNEIKNFIISTVFSFFKPYFNENVKHNDKFNSVEIDLVFNQVTSVMLFLIQLDNEKKAILKTPQKLEIV